ncbi:uncharacterized protein V1513DRAFT_454783 [Lipomyces chichibuensis]|uniref:uncharacterized protein n=1 Tax=Lipomyces chichibuensis TaxID=1546026 RepID=UPI003343C39E
MHHDTHPAIDPETKSDQHRRAVLITGGVQGDRPRDRCVIRKGVRDLDALESRSHRNRRGRTVGAADGEATAGRDDETSAGSAVSQTEKWVGCLDILINNAGYLENWKSVADSVPSEW